MMFGQLLMGFVLYRYRQPGPHHRQDDGAGPRPRHQLQQPAGDVRQGQAGEGDGGQRGQGEIFG